MRSWLFHPIVFYPLAAILAVLVIAAGVRPQAWPRPPAQVPGQVVDGALVFAGAGFDAPAAGPQQDVYVERDFYGHAQTLHIAQKPGLDTPTPDEQGVQILLTPEQAAMLAGRPVRVEVSYDPLPVNAAPGLAVALQGGGPATWVSQPTPPQTGTLVFELPAQSAVNAIALRALIQAQDQAYGLEITRIRLTPHA